jgi:DNA-binding transcriptional ArsR family regulator
MYHLVVMSWDGLDQIEECRRMAVSWAPTLRALGHPERLLIALWLTASERSVRELQEATGLGQSLVSYHLGELRAAGVVTAVPDGRSNRYRLCCSDLDELLGALAGIEAAAGLSR